VAVSSGPTTVRLSLFLRAKAEIEASAGDLDLKERSDCRRWTCGACELPQGKIIRHGHWVRGNSRAGVDRMHNTSRQHEEWRSSPDRQNPQVSGRTDREIV